MSFGRAVAIGKMTVKNLASEEPVLGVEFTAPDKKGLQLKQKSETKRM